MIEAQELSRRYDDFTAVERISFSVNEGEILGLLGPNGAGKTTIIRMITGFLPPSRGKVMVGGHDLYEAPLAARREIGYLPENVALYNEMRVQEYLTYRARLEGLGGAEARRAIDETVESSLLSDVRGQIIGTLSKGYRQRVGLATAILHRPPVLILDEPTVGLDPKQIIAIRELIRDLKKDRTVLLSTHILPEVELLCDRVLIVDRGRIVDQGTPDGLREKWRGGIFYTVTVKDDPPGVTERLGAVPGVESLSQPDQDQGRYLLEGEPGSDPREGIFQAAVEAGWVLLELAEEKASLEDIFVRLTTREETGDGQEEAEEVVS